MSWPDLACASAAPVSNSLLPWVVMKSTLTSTFSLAAHSSIRALVALLALGTQWSHNARVNLPAAWAPRTNGAAMNAVDAAAVPATKRRRAILDEAMLSSLLSALERDLWRNAREAAPAEQLNSWPSERRTSCLWAKIAAKN